MYGERLIQLTIGRDVPSKSNSPLGELDSSYVQLHVLKYAREDDSAAGNSYEGKWPWSFEMIQLTYADTCFLLDFKIKFLMFLYRSSVVKV